MVVKAKQVLGLPPADLEFQYAESLADSTYGGTSNVWQNKLTLSTGVLGSGIVYRIGLSYSWRYGWTSGDFHAQLLVDGNQSFEHRQEPTDQGTDQIQRECSFLYFTGTGVAIDIELEYTNTSGDDATIGDARLEIWKIS